MKIPSLPLSKVVSDDDQLHSNWQQYFTQLTTQLQKNFSDEGYVLPMQSNENVTTLNTSKSIGGLLYDTDDQKSKVNNAGTYEAIATETMYLTQAEMDAIAADQIDKKWVFNTDTEKLYHVLKGVFKEVQLL